MPPACFLGYPKRGRDCPHGPLHEVPLVCSQAEAVAVVLLTLWRASVVCKMGACREEQLAVMGELGCSALEGAQPWRVLTAGI